MNQKWTQRFFDRAESIASWSKDPSSKIGSVFVDSINKIELSGGYNGFPRGISDNVDRFTDRETKLKYTSHAEMNGIYNACRLGRSLVGSSLFVHGLPICSECAKGVIQVGVSEIYLRSVDVEKGMLRWKESWELSASLFDEARIPVYII